MTSSADTPTAVPDAFLPTGHAFRQRLVARVGRPVLSGSSERLGTGEV
jgi:hypothetical protein